MKTRLIGNRALWALKCFHSKYIRILSNYQLWYRLGIVEHCGSKWKTTLFSIFLLKLEESSAVCLFWNLLLTKMRMLIWPWVVKQFGNYCFPWDFWYLLVLVKVQVSWEYLFLQHFGTLDSGLCMTKQCRDKRRSRYFFPCIWIT